MKKIVLKKFLFSEVFRRGRWLYLKRTPNSWEGEVSFLQIFILKTSQVQEKYIEDVLTY